VILRTPALTRIALAIHTSSPSAKEHIHRSKASTYYVTEALNQFMACNAIGENFPILALSKHHGKVFKAALLNGSATGRRRKPGPVTISRKLSSLHHFVKWAVNIEFMEVDIVAGLALPARLVSESRTRKEGFTDEQIVAILKALSPYRESEDAMRREWYWAVILLAHRGCRALEVVQLLKGDVRQVENVWCFDLVGKGEGRQLKNKTSVRKVPVHSGVLAVGFLDWYNQQAGPRLFPLLFPFGAIKVRQWFSSMLKKRLKIKRPELTLHSLRHSFAVALEKARVHPSVSYRLMGHALPGGVHATTYLKSLSYPMKELQEAVESVKFPIL
jgi:integrase